MNVQVLTDPFERLLRASSALPGSTHDLTAARRHGIVDALADQGPSAGQTRRTKEAAIPSESYSEAVA
jgi:hypothetical protein